MNILRFAGLTLAIALAGCTAFLADKHASAVVYDPMTVGDVTLSPFYALNGVLSREPGELLRQEKLGERQSLKNAAVNLRLLYTSTNGLTDEGTVPVSGVLYLPRGEAPEGGWPLMAWTHGTVGVADICAPSWNGRQQQDEDYLNRFLESGYAVVASDYQGLGTAGTHPYLATRPAAYSNLDIIKAIQSASLPVSNQVVLFGQSQGAAAAIATAAFAPDYAPGIDLAGVVATGAPYFTPRAIEALERTQQPDKVDPMLGYTFLAMTLVQQVDPQFVMRDHISDAAWPVARRVEDACYKDIKTMVTEAGLTRRLSFAQNPAAALRQGFAQMAYPTMKIAAPVFMGTGGKDRDTPPRMQALLVRDLCAAGTKVQWARYPELDHRQVVPGSIKDSFPFVEAAFAGETVSGNCGE